MEERGGRGRGRGVIACEMEEEQGRRGQERGSVTRRADVMYIHTYILTDITYGRMLFAYIHVLTY